MMESIGILAAIGGILLLAALVWAMLRKSRQTPEDIRRTEEATRLLRQSIDREDKVTDPDMGRF